MIILENLGIKLRLNQKTGGIISIQNKIKHLNLCRTSGKTPWRLQIYEPEDSAWTDRYEKFVYEKKEDSLVLKWILKFDIEIESRIDLPKESDNAYFYVKVKNKGLKTISAIEYPIIEGIHALGKDPSKNRLVHPVASGYVFNDPIDLFEPDVRRKWHEDMFKYELYHSLYPDGFLGVGMQFLGYYIERKGGFYIAAHDPYKTVKYINFYKETNNRSLTCSFMHLAWGLQPSNNIALEYPVVVRPLCEGNWYEVADKYREWSVKQEWCQKGQLWERAMKGETSKWLLEDIGFCTFGISSAIDQADWYEAIHRITSKPVFHITAWDWAGPHTKNYNGKESWFPAAFNQRNLETIKKNGDYFAPFEFDLFYHRERPEWVKVKEFAILPSNDQLKIKAERVLRAMKSTMDATAEMKKRLQELEEILSRPNIEFSDEWLWFLSPFNPVHKNMCPVTEFWQDFHKWKDEKVVRDYGADANYYDISANNGEGGEIGGPAFCYSTLHSHPKGAGRWIIDAYRGMYEATKAATSLAKSKCVPQGTEVITEVFIDKLDFYQARAEGGPCGAFEGGRFKKWEMESKCEKVPLFTYVYHDYGPVRLDGWAKLSKEFGEIFYWIASRVTLWGGIFELNYEFSPLERFPGMDGPTGYIKYNGEWYVENMPYEVDSSKLQFLNEITAARTGFAKEYLAYGRMVRSLVIENPSINLNYSYYNNPDSDHKKPQNGVFNTKSIVQCAWIFKDEKLGFLFVNLQGKELNINVRIDPMRHGLVAKPGYGLYYTTAEKSKKICFFKKRTRRNISLPSKKIVLIEVRPL